MRGVAVRRETRIWPTYSFGRVDAVLYCKHASDPEDLAHGMQPGVTDQICTCGSRELRFERVGPYSWPITLRWDDELFDVPHYLVPTCVTRGVDDPTHAPRAIEVISGLGAVVTRCICGFEPTHEDLRALPAF